MGLTFTVNNAARGSCCCGSRVQASWVGGDTGYLISGMVIGPSGLGLFSHPDEILQVAELGVVLFCFWLD